jgi:hypothetical protein
MIMEETTKFMTNIVVWNRNGKKSNFCELPLIIGQADGHKNESLPWNPTFELAYWRFGLNVAQKWYLRQNLSVPPDIKKVYDGLVPFTTSNDSYINWEGKGNMWNDFTETSSVPKILGIFGMLPPDPHLNITIFKNTVANVYRTFFSLEKPLTKTSPDLSNNATISHAHFGTSFPILAMTAARMGDVDRAVDWLVHPDYRFDDAGMPAGSIETSNQSSLNTGGMVSVPTPYFSGAGGLLLSVAMLADGWQGSSGRKWPTSWTCRSEGFVEGI